MKLSRFQRVMRWIFPRGRVPWGALDSELYELRYKERYDRLPIFIKANIKYLICTNARMVLEVDAKGAYRAIWRFLLEAISHDFRNFRFYWKTRLEYWWLRVRGWDKTSIRLRWESEADIETGIDEGVEVE